MALHHRRVGEGLPRDAPLLLAHRRAAEHAPEPGREVRLVDDGTRLAFADLHNHTLLSDGAGDPDDAFAQMRASGLDVAALTDHAVTGRWGLTPPAWCADLRTRRGRNPCASVLGLTEDGWRRTGALADAADDPGAFVAMRGFEWSNPVLGHVNVWGSATWTDPASMLSVGRDGLADEVRRRGAWGRAVAALLEQLPDDAGMTPFYRWLAEAEAVDPDVGVVAGFNHPGREPAHFDTFARDPRVADRIVSVEVFNRDEDYLFHSYDARGTSPLAECLDAGWRVGILGVTDEHGTRVGRPQGSSRSGLWLREHSRRGVVEALRARRVYASVVPGMRLDATANGTRMGGVLGHRGGPVTFALDLSRGAEWAGSRLEAQVLRPGAPVPEVVHVEPVRFAAPGADPVTFTVDLDPADGDWVVLRIADPLALNDHPGPADHAANALGLAYASPWWLAPDQAEPGP